MFKIHFHSFALNYSGNNGKKFRSLKKFPRALLACSRVFSCLGVGGVGCKHNLVQCFGPTLRLSKGFELVFCAIRHDKSDKTSMCRFLG